MLEIIADNTWFVYLKKYRSFLLRAVLFVVAAGLIVVMLPKGKPFSYQYKVGDIWSYPNLIAPYNFAILKTEAELGQERQELENTVPPIYQLDASIGLVQQQAFREDFDFKWTAYFPLDLKEKEQVYEKIASLLKGVYEKGLISLNAGSKRNGANYSIRKVDKNVAVTVSASTLYTVERVMQIARSVLRELSPAKKALVFEVLREHLQVNLLFDKTLTKKMEAEALDRISLYLGMVAQGELIIASGDFISLTANRKIISLAKKAEEMGICAVNTKFIAVGWAILVTISLGLLMVFLFFFRKAIYQDYRKMSLLFLVITSMLLLLSFVVKLQIYSVYYIPYCIVPILIRMLFDARIALNIHLVVVILAGFFLPNGFEFVFYQITAGMVAIYSIHNMMHRSQFLISSLCILATYVLVFFAILFINGFSQPDWRGLLPFVVSVSLSLLAYPLVYAFEQIFKITTDLTLMELSNTNNKLLRELAFIAPGTFQHAMQVANLAEAAVYATSGNPLLVRTVALYHDIGKLKNPEYFIENQHKNYNPHDQLSYDQSAEIIIKHVTDGVEIAKKNRLPAVIIQAIQTHHGTTRVDYFYQSFLKNFPDSIFDEQVFRYPGPIPASKETGVLMLADSVEAASRSLKAPDFTSIENLVDKIVDHKLEQKQLINADITLKEIEVIKSVFKKMLRSIYHIRVSYETTTPNHEQLDKSKLAHLVKGF